ncbi:MAG: hypothetical protein IJB48_02075 [Clostridia bacterium]|nr:hypothetical protein [Clostridia bacterium]
MAHKQYGHYIEGSSDYCITRADLPRNWYNYLWNDHYVTFTSQTGAGESVLQDSLGRRIGLVRDRGFYLLEGEVSWGIHGLPVNQKNDKFTCTHSRGATEVSVENYGIASRVISIVPDGANCELWKLKLKNLSEEKRQLSAIVFCDTKMDGIYQRQGYHTGTASFSQALNGVFSCGFVSFEDEVKEAYGFLALSETADGYDCTYNSIIGPYGSFAHPIVLERGGLSNTDGLGEKLSFALEKKIELAPNEEKELVYICGVAFSMEEAKKMKTAYAVPKTFDLEKEAVLEKFRSQTAMVSIETPDELLNNMFEWLKHQSNLGSRWARVRHNGYRDLTSDTECLSCINPKLALERFKRILTYQYSSGYAPRTFIDGMIQPNNFADNTVWLNFAAMSIIKELGDTSILDIEVPYNDGTVGTIYEHLFRSVDYLYHFKGLHGLVKIWGGDWNDCMASAGLEGRGVSIWLSIAWYRANQFFAEIARMVGNNGDAELCVARGEEMRELIEEYGWDGEYYMYAINDWGEKIGSKESPQGQIFLNPQIWAVLSGVSKNGREVQAMESAQKKLDSELGTRVSLAYTEYDPHIGYVTLKPAGVHENGGVYLHTIAWKIAADAMLGRADWVEKDIETILPFRNKVVAGRAEPYIMCNSYFGEQTGYRYGTPGQSWRTAAGQWFQKALVNYVFGLQPEMDGLKIEPCLPPSWKKCAIRKVFRGITYDISYENGGTRVKEIYVNNEKIDGNILPLLDDIVKVKVITGE